MNIDDFSDLPNWDDRRMRSEEDEDGEGWKPNPARDACKTLYNKWQQVMFLLKGILLPVLDKREDSIEASMDIDTARDLHGDAYIVGAKILSSEAGNMYVLRMENAAIVRKLAQGIATGLLLFLENDSVDEAHIKVIREEIDEFKSLFIIWVQTFKKDEFSDDWGLFM